MRDVSEWTPETAEAVAREAGIGPLTADHWTVIAHCREDAARRGLAPCLRRLSELTGLREARIGQLFPGTPASLVIRIAGLEPPPDRFRNQQGRL
jgi:tRNA 2-thiouridine synthesizing protein E